MITNDRCTPSSSFPGPREALGEGWHGELRVPPVHETNTVDRVQHHLDTLIPSQLFSSEYGRILELQAHPVVPHVCAHVNGKLKEAERVGVSSLLVFYKHKESRSNVCVNTVLRDAPENSLAGNWGGRQTTNHFKCSPALCKWPYDKEESVNPLFHLSSVEPVQCLHQTAITLKPTFLISLMLPNKMILLKGTTAIREYLCHEGVLLACSNV